MGTSGRRLGIGGEIYAISIVADEENGTFAFGTPRLIKQLPISVIFPTCSASRFGDVLHPQAMVIDPEDPCPYWDETGILFRNYETNEYEDISFNLRECVAQAGYDAERGFSVARLNSHFQAIGTVDGRLFHYDFISQTVTDTTDALRSNPYYLRHSDAGSVVGDMLGANRGAIWDPLTGQVVEIPIDLGDGSNTTFVPLSDALVEVAVAHSSGQVSFESGTTGSDGTVRWSYSNSNADDYSAEVLEVSHPDYD